MKRIVHSFWTRPKGINLPVSELIRNTFGYSTARDHLTCWALSAWSCYRAYPEAQHLLITDTPGARLLIDHLKLPFTAYMTVLDETPFLTPGLWVMGKLHAYQVVEAPFLHVDGDAFIWEPLSNLTGQEPLIAQSEESDTRQFHWYAPTRKAIRYAGIKEPVHTEDTWAYNVGFIGGTNEDFFREYGQMSTRFLIEHGQRIKMPEFAINLYAEQLLFGSLARAKRIPVKTLVRKNWWHMSKAEKGSLPLCHLLGPSKLLRERMVRAARRLFDFSEETALRIENLPA